MSKRLNQARVSISCFLVFFTAQCLSQVIKGGPRDYGISALAFGVLGAILGGASLKRGRQDAGGRHWLVTSAAISLLFFGAGWMTNGWAAAVPLALAAAFIPAIGALTMRAQDPRR